MRIRILCAIGLFAIAALAQAQGGKTTRILVGFPPGQATDIVARLVAERLSAALGHPVIVENKPGQGGSVVLAQLAKSPADGSVLTLSALAAPAGTPREVRERIGGEAAKAIRTPEFAEKLAAIGAVPRPSTPDEFGALLRAESPRWREIVAKSGAKAE